MANPTSNFGWQMPTNTDLVKDLPADFETFGQAVDTSLADLKGGTTGQILSKNSGTDMDFVWINNDQGDITAVNVTSPITGGGTAGAVTVGIQDGTTAQKGAVQLENSTSSTSTTTAAVPASVKSAYDLANGAIPKTLTTTTGDIIYASSANTPARLGIGSSGQVLTVSGGVPAWGAAGTAFVGCRVTKSANQTISNNTATAITFNQETYDTDGFHDNATNNTRITIPSGKGGYYHLAGYVPKGTQTSGQADYRIYKNGSLMTYNSMSQTGSGSNGGGAISDIVNLAVGDYLEVYFFQDSGGNVTVYGGSETVYFAVRYLGA